MVIAQGRPTASAAGTGTSVTTPDEAAEAAEADEPDGGRAQQHAPRLLEQHLLGVTSMAVITVDGHGRVGHWNRAAADLFGVTGDQAAGRPLAALLRLPPEHRAAFEPGPSARAWCGAYAVPRVDDGEPAEVAWWVYPVDRPGEAGEAGADVRLLAVAADLRRLREDGPGLGMGDVLVADPGDGPLPASTGLHVLHVEPALARVGDGDAARFGRRLAGLLPPMGSATAARVTASVLAAGYPAIDLSVVARLPIVPYWGGMPRALRIRPRAAGGALGPIPPHPRRPERSEAMAVRERLAFLGEAGERIGGAADHLKAARVLAEVLVPALADFADVSLLDRVAAAGDRPAVDGAARLRRVAVVHDDGPGRWDDTLPEDEIAAPPPDSPCTTALTSGRGLHIPLISAERAEQISLLYTGRDLRPLLTGRALLILPLVARGEVLGLCALTRRPGRPGFDEDDLATIGELVRRAALCVDNGRLYRREVELVQQLQRSLLPAGPPEVPGARVCFRYRPAGQAAQVGGDWFDAIPLPGCRLGVVVGDVMGDGLTSAAVMGQLRTAVRTLAAQDLRPDQLLQQLDGLARRLGDDCVATCAYAVYDPVARRVEFANAGHLPPVLVDPAGESRVLPIPAGLPIGVGGEPFETVELDIPDGSRLVWCTDGLVERRDRDVEQGMEALRGQLAGASTDLAATCDAVLEALGQAVPADDIALVAVGCDGIPAADVATWRLPAEPSMVPRARAQAAERLAAWGLDELTDTVELLVSELVTNALVHGAGEIGMRMIRGGALLCEVSDDGDELPVLCRATSTDESGRGLQLVSYLAARWGTHRTERGKVVWFEHALPD
ncbi:ATP-binding SpoIIE family protein phosphatase [Actinomadura hibisca]|uniref:ATP-binding SpoIIE family protein phosphatase n=1 Tax=Actinomadura hibisca TaxID=68565 RepID=UPI000B0A0ACC|nr:SpoIIE family protein phosphatase [Actinomadura hibisca]